MASVNTLVIRNAAHVWRGRGLNLQNQGTSEAGKVFSNTGAILSMPTKTQYAKTKIIAVTIAGLYAGVVSAKKLAEFMEENDIFIPNEDD